MTTSTPLPTASAPPAPPPPRLLGQVARLAAVPANVLQRMRHEAVSAPTRGVVEYGDYQSGGWWTAALMNHSASGDPHDTVIGDGRARPTRLLEAMPVTAAFLHGLGLDYMFVRLARLEPNAFLWEHRDYAELTDRPRHRLHIPLVTNPSAVLVTAGARVHLAAGAVWRLTPSVPHGVCNDLGPERLHVIADVYADGAYAAFAGQPYLDPGDDAALVPLNRADADRHEAAADRLAGLGFVGQAEQLLLRLYYRHALPEGGAYDMVAALHDRLGDHAAARRWRTDADALLARTSPGDEAVR